jgi:hypothetical protein
LGWSSWEPTKTESLNQAAKRESGSWSQHTFEKYTGLNYEELSDFARLLYEKGITVDENGFSDKE